MEEQIRDSPGKIVMARISLYETLHESDLAIQPPNKKEIIVYFYFAYVCLEVWL